MTDETPQDAVGPSPDPIEVPFSGPGWDEPIPPAPPYEPDAEAITYLEKEQPREDVETR